MTDSISRNRRRYRFLGRDNQNRYVWQSVERVPGDSRVEEIRCDADWFWRGGVR